MKNIIAHYLMEIGPQIREQVMCIDAWCALSDLQREGDNGLQLIYVTNSM